MPYRYRDDVAVADVAFEAWGANPEEAFIAAADATMNVMVSDLATIEQAVEMTIDVEREQLDLLLFSFLNELVFLKDARRLLLRVRRLDIEEQASGFKLRASAFGDPINPGKHPLSVDVKAVTLHEFKLTQTNGEWRAFVILDI